MDKIIYLLLILFLYLLRWLFFSAKNKKSNFLWVSLFIVCTPFSFEKVLAANETDILMSGTLGALIKITFQGIMAIVLLFVVGLNKITSHKYNTWILGVFILIGISLINPYNALPGATSVFLVFFISNILTLLLLYYIVSYEQLIKGIYDGFFILSIVQLVLAICFPLLEISAVTGLFHKGGEEWATRFGTRNGAIGLFVHPGALALYTIISSCFFFSTFLMFYNRRLSFILLCINTVILYFTFSRTAYITFLIVLIFMYFIYKNANKNIFKVSNIIKFVLPVFVCLIWLLYLSPFADFFQKGDSSEQYENRMTHWLMAYNIFNESPFIGVGLNTHLAYVDKNFPIINKITTNEFFTINPIHNIHLIVLAETGLAGLILWFIFFIRNIAISKRTISNGNNEIMALTFIGVLVAIFIYGITGWAPFSSGILPLFLLIAYFSVQFNKVNNISSDEIK